MTDEAFWTTFVVTYAACFAMVGFIQYGLNRWDMWRERRRAQMVWEVRKRKYAESCRRRAMESRNRA